MTKDQFNLYKNAFLTAVGQPAGDEEARSLINQAMQYAGKVDAMAESTKIVSPFSVDIGRTLSLTSGDLSLEKTYLFPQENPVGPAGKLVEDFVSVVKKVTSEDFYGAEQILAAAHHKLSTVPVNDTEVSLYDYARLVTAIAICLNDGREASDNCLLLKGDLSGIQDFIFDVVSKGAARSLKGRSFRVQMVTQMYVDYLLRTLGLSPANLLYEGGGNFYMLVPKSKEATLTGFRRDLSAGLLQLEQESGEKNYLPIPEKLRMIIGWAEIPYEGLAGKVNDTWAGVNTAVSHARLRYHREADFDDIFQPIPAISYVNRREAEADIYRHMTRQLKDLKSYSFEREQPDWVSVISTGGARIPGPYSVAKTKLAFGKPEHDGYDFLDPQTSLTPEQPFRLAVNQLPVWSDSLLSNYQEEIRRYNDRNQSDTDFQPPKKDKLIEFDQLCLFAEKRTGTSKLGILKMDVDHLGKAFISGRRTLLKNMALSRGI